MARCARPDCGGTLLRDASTGQYVCLLCSRPADRALDPLPLVTEQRHRAPRPPDVQPGWRCLREIAAATGLTKATVFMRLKARGIAYRRGANRTTLVAEGDVAALVLGAKEWRERGKVG